MATVQRILVVVQGTEDCLTVFDYAAGLAETFGAKLFVLDIIHNPFAYTGWNLPMPSMAKEYQSLLHSIRERMQAMTNERRNRGFPVETLVREGDPASEIIKVVEEEKIDMLVMPAHEETRMEHFLWGKMAERIIRNMPCSILLLKLEPENLCSSET